MNLLLLGALLAGASFSQEYDDLSLETVEAALSSKCKLRELYDQFRVDHGLIRCKKEHPHRWDLFRKSLETIRKMKRNDEITWDVGLTPLSDLTDAEFETQYLGYNISLQESSILTEEYETPSLQGPAIPESFDWRNPNGDPKDTFVTPIQHQREGSCWARAAMVPLESQVKELSGVLLAFSVFEAYDCTYDGENGYDGRGGAGRPKDVWLWLQKYGRLSSRAEIPDRPGNLPTHYMKLLYADTPNYFARFEVERIKWVRDEDGLVSSVYQTSPVAISFATKSLRDSHFRGYKGKPLFSNDCTQDVDHSMAVVGYTKDTLIIKNTWGEGWGDKGYLIWKRHQPGANCGLYRQASYPTLKYYPKGQKEKKIKKIQ